MADGLTQRTGHSKPRSGLPTHPVHPATLRARAANWRRGWRDDVRPGVDPGFEFRDSSGERVEEVPKSLCLHILGCEVAISTLVPTDLGSTVEGSDWLALSARTCECLSSKRECTDDDDP